MKALIKLMALGLILSSQQAMARNFYLAQMDATVHFSQLTEETQVLAKDFTLDVRYSDDHDFCRVYVGRDAFLCQSYHPVGQPEHATITMNREDVGALVAKILEVEDCNNSVGANWERLAVYLSDTVDLEHQGMDFYQQVHDRAPESFHLWLYELTAGEKY